MSFIKNDRCRTILITSCKGGVGKSTVSANLSVKLASLGAKTLLIDCDFGIRCLDLIMGLSDKAIYDLCDIVLERVPLDKAIIADEKCENLYFIPAPFNFDSEINEENFKKTIEKIKAERDFDFIIIDTPGGMGLPIKLAASVADTAYIVTAPSAPAIRAAEKTGNYLREGNISSFRLLINKMEGRNIRKAKNETVAMIDKTYLKLIGVVPYDLDLERAAEEGKLCNLLPDSNIASQAFCNIALRTMGLARPLFYKIKRLRQR